MEYLKQAAEFARQGVASFAMPQLTDWVCTGTGGTTLSVDIADFVTGGTTALVPININLQGGSTEISLRHRTAHLDVTMEGYGGGFSVGLGWGIPIRAIKFINGAGGSYGGGSVLGVEPLGGISLPSGGIGCVVAGPKARGPVIAPADLEGYLTIGFVELNSVLNGFTGGVAIFADRPVLTTADLLFMKAFSLIWGFQLVGGSVSADTGAMVYRLKLRESSLPFPGARFGASVAGA